MPKKQKKKKKPNNQGAAFMGILILFAGFSIYALTSFFSSTDQHLDRLYGSVIAATDEMPPDCATCPETPVCDPYCAAGQNDQDEGEEPYEIFPDVLSNHDHAEAIEALLYAGIISGYPDGTFRPENTINRAELLTVLTTATNADLSGNYGNCFSDVTDQWFAPFVCYAAAQGWVNGNPDGSYAPAEPVNRAASVKIVLEAFDYEIPEEVDEKPFDDVELHHWYVKHAHVAKESGIVTGRFFNADHQMTRAQYVQMVYDAMVYKELL